MRTAIIGAIIGISLAGAAVAAPTTSATSPAPAAKTAPAPAAKPAPAATPAATTPAKKGGGVPAANRSPISKACSAQADAKGLHGKDRKTFRTACIKKG